MISVKDLKKKNHSRKSKLKGYKVPALLEETVHKNIETVHKYIERIYTNIEIVHKYIETVHKYLETIYKNI